MRSRTMVQATHFSLVAPAMRADAHLMPRLAVLYEFHNAAESRAAVQAHLYHLLRLAGRHRWWRRTLRHAGRPCGRCLLRLHCALHTETGKITAPNWKGYWARRGWRARLKGWLFVLEALWNQTCPHLAIAKKPDLHQARAAV